MGSRPSTDRLTSEPRKNCSDREKVKVEMSEGKLSAVWDHCLADGIVKTGAGGALGSLFSLVLFKRKLWPVTFGLGIGFGIACSNCQHEELSSSIFQVCPCVRYPPVLALYHQFRTKIANLLTHYHQVPTIAVLY